MNSPKRAFIVEEESEGDADSQFSGSDEEADEFLDFITTADGQSCAGESRAGDETLGLSPCTLGLYFLPYYEEGTVLSRKGAPIDEHALSLSSTEHKLECKLDSASTTTARKLGSELHAMVQVECGGRGAVISGDMRAYELTMRKVGVLLRVWMDENGLVLDTNLTEKLLLSESKEVSGRIDLVFRTREGVLVVGEIKTTHTPISYADHIRSNTQIKVCTLVQMSEYVELLRETEAVSCTGALVSLKFHEDLVKLEVVAVDLQERTAMGEHALVPMELAYWLRNVSSTVPRPRYDRDLERRMKRDREQLAKMLGLYKCVDCGKVFSWRSRLVVHLRVHSGVKPYPCTQCEKSFARISALVIHARTHNGDKPFVCDWIGCKFTCSTGSSLITHKRVHTNERPYSCDCGFACKTNSDLVVHKRVHTGEKPYECDRVGCKHAYKSSTALAVHKRVHSGKRLYQCEDCGKCFTRSYVLKRHRTNHL